MTARPYHVGDRCTPASFLATQFGWTADAELTVTASTGPMGEITVEDSNGNRGSFEQADAHMYIHRVGETDGGDGATTVWGADD